MKGTRHVVVGVSLAAAAFFAALVMLVVGDAPRSLQAHTVKPGAKISGIVHAQPDAASLKGQRARVLVGVMSIVPEHDSALTGTEAKLSGNGNAVAVAVNAQTGDSFSMRLTGKPQTLRLPLWLKIPGSRVSTFLLFVDYKGSAGDVVPKVKVEEHLEKTKVVSYGHGEQQNLRITVYLPTDGGDTITLK